MDFASALDTRANDIEKPPVQPQGTYTWNVTKVPSMSRTKAGDWDIVEFTVVAVAAESDVDPDELDAYGDLRSSINRIPFMFPTDPDKDTDRLKTLNRLKKFLQSTLRVDCPEDATIKEMLANSVNCQFLGQATWRQSPDGEDTYVDVKNYAALD
jgi:hypothetical protein